MKFPGAKTQITNIKNAVATINLNGLKKGDILGHTDLDDEPSIAAKIQKEATTIMNAWVPGDHRWVK